MRFLSFPANKTRYIASMYCILHPLKIYFTLGTQKYLSTVLPRQTESDRLHLLQALQIHQPLPIRRQTECCHHGAHSEGFVWHWYSPSLLWGREHLGLLWYPDGQQVLWALTEEQGRASTLVALTFSPGKPLSPTMPGSVRPGRPCIIHSDVSSKLYSSTLTPSSRYALEKLHVINDWDTNDSSDTPYLLWVQAVQPLPVRVHINGWNYSNYLCTEWSLLKI